MLILLKIASTHSDYHLTSQVSYFIRKSFGNFTNTSAIKNVTIFPILLKRLESSASNRLSEALFNDELNLGEKFNVFRWLVLQREEKVSKDFFNYILRIIDR